MDALTPLLILAAKKAAEEAREEKSVSSLVVPHIGVTMSAVGAPIVSGIGLTGLSAFLPTAACTVAALAGVGLGVLRSTDTKPEEKQDNVAGTTAESPAYQASGEDERLVAAVVERIKAELPTLLETLNTTSSRTIVSETYDTVYRSQIAAAQEFLNENRSADLSRVKCLLHKLLPRDYFDYIEQLREHQDPQTIINIMGGQNIVAPNAQEASQSFHGEKKSKKGS